MTEYFIYKIYCKDETITDIYIGSTKTSLRRRWNNHKSICDNQICIAYNDYKYQFIRENGGIANWDIIEIERLVCDVIEARIRERYWIEELNATLNRVRAYATIEERKKQNYESSLKEHRKEYRKKWKKENEKEKIKCECGGKYTSSHKSRHYKTKLHQSFIALSLEITK